MSQAQSDTRRATLWVALLILASISPLMAIPASAADSILLSVDILHVQLSPGHSSNITMTIDNNGSSIEDFNISIYSSGLASSWTVLAAEEVVEDVLPTFSADTIIVVRLGIGAQISDSGNVAIYVNESDGSSSSMITVQLTVRPQHGASIDAEAMGDMGMVSMAPGSTLDLNISVTNQGNVIDSILLAVEEEPDISQWWVDWEAAQLPQPSGNESVLITTPANDSYHNISDGNLSISVDLDNLTADLGYDFSLVASYPENGSQVWSVSSVVNQSNDSTTVNETWNASDLGNITLDANLSWNSSSISSMSIVICLHSGDDCIAAPPSNGSGNGSGNGSSMPMSGGGRAVPNGWQARWLDDQLLDMNPQESRIRTLRITVPGGIQPIYQGFSLSAASTQGNLTWTTTLVVNVTEETNGTYTDLTDLSVQWLPGISENLSVKFTNLGTYYAEHIHSVQSKTGECEFQVMQPDGGLLAPSEPETISVQATIPSSAHLNDICSVTLQAANIADNSSIHTSTINLTIGVLYALRLDSPSSILNISPGETKQVTWVVANDGSEEDEIYFESQSAAGVSIYPPSTWVVVQRGDSEQFNVDVSVAEGVSIVDFSTFTITAKSRHSQASSAAEGALNISARYGYSVAGPADNRVQVLPNSSTQFSITVDSDSTVNQSLSLGSSGLSSELSLALENESQSMVLEPSSQFTISLLLDASPTAALGDHAFSIIITSDDGGSETLNLMAQVLAESDVKISATSEWVVVGSREVVSTVIQITNLGNSNDTFLIEVDDSSAGTSLEISMNSNFVSLGPGQSSNIDITLRRLSDGPAHSVNLIISASSTTDDSTFSWNLTVLEQTVDASVVFLNTPSEVSPSETLSGSLVLSNTGNAADSFLLSMSGLSCDIAAEHELEAGASSAAIPFTCNASKSLLAGAKNLEVSIYSLSDPSATISASHILEVSSSFIPGVDVVEITVSSSQPAMNYDSSTTITITVKNKVNHIIDISMALEGDNSGLVYASWTDLSSDSPGKTARLGPGSSASFSLQLDSMTNDQSIAHLTVLVSSSFDGLEVVDRSGAVDVNIAGPHQAPSGLVLPFSMEIDNQKGLTYLAGGWILSFVLLTFIILRAKSRKGREDEIIIELPPLVDLPPPLLEEPDIAMQVPTAPLDAGGLGVGEVRITSDRRVECPSCQAKLGLPRGSEAPFRFTCPTCESSIRVVK